jgi:hypothetical protein
VAHGLESGDTRQNKFAPRVGLAVAEAGQREEVTTGILYVGWLGAPAVSLKDAKFVWPLVFPAALAMDARFPHRVIT